MVDLDNASVQIECPNCDFYTEVTIGEIRLQDVLICRGCKMNIRLQDYLGTVASARSTLQHAIDSLADTLSRIRF